MEGLWRQRGRPLGGVLQMGALFQTGTGGGAEGFATTGTAPQRVRAQWWRRRALGLAEGDAAGDGARVGGGTTVLPSLPVWRGGGSHFL